MVARLLLHVARVRWYSQQKRLAPRVTDVLLATLLLSRLVPILSDAPLVRQGNVIHLPLCAVRLVDFRGKLCFNVV